MLSNLHEDKDRRVIVGPGDDAGVCLFEGGAIVETVDVITPLVDDPYTFGAISAANSMSDVYAMGGTPVTALAILGFSSCDYGHSVIKELLEGAQAKIKEAGAALIGGHSIEDAEFKFGLSVTGRVDKNKILRAGGAVPGDILILTKPLGTGILASAFKRKAINDKDLKKAIVSMLTLNGTASKAALAAGAHAATDITGFGLIGHALNMVKDSKTDFVFYHDKIPVMEKVKNLAASGIAPKGAHNNLKFFSDKITFPKNFSNAEKLILSDPQTSGGLLIAVPQKGINKFRQFAQRKNMPYWEIGNVVKGRGRIVVEG
ncbi:MAG: selenide, water dikinase SelD [Nitrospirae bacterium]|nr:selenide, water dikinase SelD [Nitrospirota bacterium]